MDQNSKNNSNSTSKVQGNSTSKTGGNQYSQKKNNNGSAQSVKTSDYSDSVSGKQSGKS